MKFDINEAYKFGQYNPNPYELIYKGTIFSHLFCITEEDTLLFSLPVCLHGMRLGSITWGNFAASRSKKATIIFSVFINIYHITLCNF